MPAAISSPSLLLLPTCAGSYERPYGGCASVGYSYQLPRLLDRILISTLELTLPVTCSLHTVWAWGWGHSNKKVSGRAKTSGGALCIPPILAIQFLLAWRSLNRLVRNAPTPAGGGGIIISLGERIFYYYRRVVSHFVRALTRPPLFLFLPSIPRLPHPQILHGFFPFSQLPILSVSTLYLESKHSWAKSTV
jgi:hypothetical protein